MDSVQSFIIENQGVRGALVRLDQVAQKVLTLNDYSAAVQAVLAEALAGVLLLASINKVAGRLSLQFQGGKAIQMLSVQYMAGGFVRGLVQLVEGVTTLDKAAVLHDLNSGVLSVVYQADHAGRQYQSVVPFVGDSLTESLQHYYMQSEQQATHLQIVFNSQAVVGFMLQALPEAGQDLEERWSHVLTLAQTLAEEELFTCDN